MLTIDEAMHLASTGIKPDTSRVEAHVPLFELDSTPIWREFLSGMRMAFKRCKRGKVGLEEVTEHNVLLLHEVISLTANFQLALRKAEQSVANDRHWYCQRLIDNEQVQANLLTIYQGQPLPLHDHPGSNGMQLVISGKAHVRRYNLAQNVKSDHADVALIKIADRLLGMGEVDVFTSDRGNIHGMRAMSSRCIVLDITMPPSQHENASWYLP